MGSYAIEERNKLNNIVIAKPFKSMDSKGIEKPAKCSKSTSLSQVRVHETILSLILNEIV